MSMPGWTSPSEWKGPPSWAVVATSNPKESDPLSCASSASCVYFETISAAKQKATSVRYGYGALQLVSLAARALPWALSPLPHCKIGWRSLGRLCSSGAVRGNVTDTQTSECKLLSRNSRYIIAWLVRRQLETWTSRTGAARLASSSFFPSFIHWLVCNSLASSERSTNKTGGTARH